MNKGLTGIDDALDVTGAKKLVALIPAVVLIAGEMSSNDRYIMFNMGNLYLVISIALFATT